MALEQSLLDDLHSKNEFHRLDLIRCHGCPFSNEPGWVAIQSDGRAILHDAASGISVLAWGRPQLAIELRQGVVAAVGPTPQAAMSHLHQFLTHRSASRGTQV